MATLTTTGEAGVPSPARPVPAVVLGGTLNGLGIVRSLVLAGAPIYVIDTSWRCPAAWSRHCHFVRAASWQAPVLLQVLIDLAGRLQDRPVLFLTSDECVTLVSAHRERLAALYRLNLPSESICTLADKTAFHAFAERQGLAIPRGLCVDRQTGFQHLEELTPPLVLKPADKTLVINGVVERAVRVETQATARIAAEEMLQRVPRLIAQEWIDGLDSDIYFTLFSCDRRGRIVGLFPGRKLLCSPPAIGTTAVCVAAPEAREELYRQTSEFISLTDYRGIGSLEFKRDARTGRFLIVEPTIGRTDWQEEIATLCGVNLPFLTYNAELHEVAPVIYGNESASSAWRSSREFRIPAAMLRIGTRLFDGYLRQSDPIPAVYYYVYERLVLRAWRRALRTMMSRRNSGD
jgi:D-aspartate ligase